MDDVRFRYLAAKALAESQEWEDCLALLGEGEAGEDEASMVSSLVRKTATG